MSRNIAASQPLIDLVERRPAPQGNPVLGLWHLLTVLVQRAVAAWSKRRRAQRAIAELSCLSNRMLRDIGIERHDIERVVRYGRGAGERSR